MLATGYSNAAQEAASEFVVLRKPYQLADLSRAVARVQAQARQETTPGNLVNFREALRDRKPKPGEG